MKIPEKIVIGGIEVDIEYNDELLDRDNCTGVTAYEHQRIYIDPSVPGQDIVNQSFIHEIVHYVLYVMGKHTLRKDEEFVDGFAHLAYQIIKQIEEK